MNSYIVKESTMEELTLLLSRIKVFGGSLRQVMPAGPGENYFISYRATKPLIERSECSSN